MSPRDRRLLAAGIALGAIAALAGWAEVRAGWVEPAFRALAHLFYEQSALAEVRRPGQVVLARGHLAILAAIAVSGLVAAPWMGRHGRLGWAIFGVGYALRATVWVVGGTLPLVPGDSCHYLEVARSVYRGEGPVKHYVESFFIDYRAHGILEGRGVLDDWATPLWAYVLAIVYRAVGVVPGRSLEATVAVAKGASFACNLLCLPALYGFARRRFGPGVGLGALAALAILPVHVIYAGFALRESLVALTSILAIWTLTEVWHAPGRSSWAWAIVAGLGGGLAILARNTALALLAAAGAYGLVVHGRRRLGPLVAWGLVVLAVIAPWAWATYREYGEPFYTYTKYFQYNFSWAVHHYQQGNTRPGQFYNWSNAPEIIRVKIKSLFIIAIYSFMIFGYPLVMGFAHRLAWPRDAGPEGRDVDRLGATLGAVFVLATLANIADVTQVAQLGRYYLPVFALALPTAAAGLGDWLRASVIPAKYSRILVGTALLLWADPTWAYDATWLVKPYQLHWPALRAAGDWVREHPAAVPAESRIMTWFPWEFRVVGDRTTILLPRSYYGPQIERTIRQYGVTHVLWGSFEPPPDVDPETWGPYLERLRRGLGLTDAREVYRSPGNLPYPVRLYRIDGGRP